jgi:hypothetical protein
MRRRLIGILAAACGLTAGAVATSALPASAAVPIRGTFTPVDPVRVLDTRDGTGVAAQRRGPLGRGQVFALHLAGTSGIPADARAVLLNVTVTEAQGPGFVTVFPCGRPVPVVSNLNFVGGVDRANLVKARLGVNGDVCFFAFVGTQLVADLDGWFTPTPVAA